MRCAIKITHISTVTYLRVLNLVPNQSSDISLLSICRICNYLICVFINIYENIKNVIQDGGIPTKLILSQLLLIIDH